MDDKKEAQKAYDKLFEIYHAKRLKGKDHNELLEMPTSFSLMGNVKNKKVLDAGCGTGIYSRMLAKKGAKVYALELSPNMLKIAKEHCKDSNIEFKGGSIDKLPYKNSYFDVILASLVLHYLKNPEKAFKEFNRVLKKKGILVFSTHHPVREACKDVKKIGRRRVMILSDYYKRGKEYWHLHNSKVQIPSYRVDFEKLFDMAYKNGFIVEKFKEPYISKEMAKKDITRRNLKFIGIPSFLVIKCKKIK